MRNKIACRALSLLIGLSLTLSVFPFPTAAEEITAPPPKIEPPKGKTADDLYLEAKTISDKYPGPAIQLLKECLAMKPELWQARMHLATMYENQNMLNLAISEYEAVNRTSASPESFAGLVRVLEKGNYPHNAATTAVKAFEVYPDKPDFLLKAGGLFSKTGNDKEATTVLRKFLQLKPEDGNAYLLLGGIQEKAGLRPEATRAYLRAVTLLPKSQAAADALKQLAAKAYKSDKILIFLPPGWIVDQNTISNPTENMRLTVTASAGGTPESIALKSARATIPGDLFSDENLKSYENMKAMMEKAGKDDVEHPKAAQLIQSLPSLPFFSKNHRNDIVGAYMVLLATSERPQPGVISVCAVAVPAGRKTYSFVLKADAPAPQAEKALASILSQTILDFTSP